MIGRICAEATVTTTAAEMKTTTTMEVKRRTEIELEDRIVPESPRADGMDGGGIGASTGTEMATATTTTKAAAADPLLIALLRIEAALTLRLCRFGGRTAAGVGGGRERSEIAPARKCISLEEFFAIARECGAASVLRPKKSSAVVCGEEDEENFLFVSKSGPRRKTKKERGGGGTFVHDVGDFLRHRDWGGVPVRLEAEERLILELIRIASPELYRLSYSSWKKADRGEGQERVPKNVDDGHDGAPLATVMLEYCTQSGSRAHRGMVENGNVMKNRMDALRGLYRTRRHSDTLMSPLSSSSYYYSCCRSLSTNPMARRGDGGRVGNESGSDAEREVDLKTARRIVLARVQRRWRSAAGADVNGETDSAFAGRNGDADMPPSAVPPFASDASAAARGIAPNNNKYNEKKVGGDLVAVRKKDGGKIESVVTSRIVEPFILPGMSLEERVRARADNRLRREKTLSTKTTPLPSNSYQDEIGSSTAAAVSSKVAFGTSPSILIRVADALRFHLRNRASRASAFGVNAGIGSRGLNSSLGLARNAIFHSNSPSRRRRRHCDCPTPVASASASSVPLSELCTSLSGAVRTVGSAASSDVRHNGGGGGLTTTTTVKRGMSQHMATTTTTTIIAKRASERAVARVVSDLASVVPEWIRIVDRRRRGREEAEGREGDNGWGNIRLPSRDAVVVVRNDVDFRAVRAKLGARVSSSLSSMPMEESFHAPWTKCAIRSEERESDGDKTDPTESAVSNRPHPPAASPVVANASERPLSPPHFSLSLSGDDDDDDDDGHDHHRFQNQLTYTRMADIGSNDKTSKSDASPKANDLFCRGLNRTMDDTSLGSARDDDGKETRRLALENAFRNDVDHHAARARNSSSPSSSYLSSRAAWTKRTDRSEERELVADGNGVDPMETVGPNRHRPSAPAAANMSKRPLSPPLFSLSDDDDEDNNDDDDHQRYQNHPPRTGVNVGSSDKTSKGHDDPSAAHVFRRGLNRMVDDTLRSARDESAEVDIGLVPSDRYHHPCHQSKRLKLT